MNAVAVGRQIDKANQTTIFVVALPVVIISMVKAAPRKRAREEDGQYRSALLDA